MDFDFNDNIDFEEEKRRRDSRAVRSAQREKARRKKLFARRATIVGIMLLIVVLIVTLIIVGVNALIKSIGGGGVEETTAPTVAPTEAPTTLNFKEPEIPDDKKSKGYFSSANGAVYIYEKAAYEIFSGDEASAKSYAECISSFKALLGDDVTVYNMVVPTHIEFGVPKRLKENGEVTTSNQIENLKAIYSSYTEDVVAINCYNKLSEHVKEYLYFNTDYYWTGLGAYYGYQAFCEQADKKILDLSICKDNSAEGFEGQLLYCDTSLYENLDTVHYWTFPYNTYAMRTDSNGAIPYETTIYYEAAVGGPYTYGAFLWGDCPLFVEYNKDLTNGEKILVVKDSYGNPFAPYLTANYEQVHIIDYRYYDGNLIKYCTENSIDEVLFINNIMSANSSGQQDSLKSLS
ncbi:MAG: hypothetical protein IJD68_02930 [Ruminococcus sp.]|nr:hypothetical protein [Ruminococcus sp.]